MKKNNKNLLFTLIFTSLVALVGIFFIFRSNNNSVNIQMQSLKGGDLEERKSATIFMQNNMVKEAVPYIIANINFRESLESQNASSTLACISVQTLEKMSGYKASYINICQNQVFNDNYLVDSIQKNWQNWYANQIYPGWLFYQNKDLGFEIKYPKEILDWDSDCKSDDREYYDGYAKVPLKFFEDKNNIYIGNEYFYKIVDGSCNKIYNSVDALKNENTWKIVIKDNIYDDNDLNRFIKDFYAGFGGNCSLGQKKETSQDGVYDIITDYDGKDLEESECFINGWSAMKYYPAKGKVAAWLIGQEPNFWGDQYGDITYDQEMVDSFRFLE